MWTKGTNLKENKLIGQGLAEIIMLLSHLGEYACEWAYKCNAAPIRNDNEKHLQCVLCKLDTHVLHSRFICNTFVRFAMTFASIANLSNCNIFKTVLLGS